MTKQKTEKVTKEKVGKGMTSPADFGEIIADKITKKFGW